MRYLTMASLLFWFIPPFCFADGDCPDRPATSQESAVYAAVHAAALAAIPAPPPNWLRQDESDLRRGEVIPACPGGSGNAPHRYRFSFRYKYDQIGRLMAERNSLASAAQGTAEQQSRLAALDREADELKAARKLARRGGDRSAVNRIEERLDQLRVERKKLEGDIADAFQDRLKSGGPSNGAPPEAQPRQPDAEVVVQINEDKVWAPRPTTEPLQIGGARHAYWRANDRGTLVVLLGEWKWEKNLLQARPAAGPLPTQPRTVVVEIAAERQMAEQLAREIRLEQLQAQIR